MKEKKTNILNVRLSRRQHLLLANMSKQKQMSRSILVRRALFNGRLLDEPDYTPEDIAKDKRIIKDKLDAINKRILRQMPLLPLAERESILSKLMDIESALKRTVK